MQSRARWRSTLASLVAALAITGCGDATGPAAEVDAGIATGSYVLEPEAGIVSNGAPSSGTLVLTADGSATRRVRYVAVGSGAVTDFVARGTFRLLADGVVEFALHEDDGASPYLWQPKGSRTGTRISIRYGNPLDGPDIVERYRKE